MEGLLFLFVVFIIIYFLPTFIASGRRHPATCVIFLFNLLLGWTMIVWLFLLIWAFMAPEPRRPAVQMR